MAKLPFTNKEKAKILDAIAGALDIFVVTRPDNVTIRYASKKTAEKLGYKLKDMIGKPVGMLFKHQSERKEKILPVVLKRGHIENYEVTLLTTSGDDLHTSATIARIAGGGTVGAGKDISKEINSDREKLAMLYNILEYRKPYLRGHGQRVSEYSLLIADALKLAYPLRKALEHGAPLHDFGKLGVEDDILSSKKQFRASRHKQLRQHPAIGDELLQRQNQSSYTSDIRAIVRWHHEYVDGTGYPDGLKGNKIPYVAKIIAVADVYDALRSTRPYRKKIYTLEEAKEYIATHIGKQFDPRVAIAFLKIPDGKLEKIAKML